MEKKPTSKPAMDWQVDEYARTQEFRFVLPYQFLLLCKLIGVPPKQLLLDFMDNLSCGSWKREGRDKAKEKLIEYTPEDLRMLFREMDAVGLLFPDNDSEMIDIYAKWREEHHRYWFKKWWTKYRRKNLIGLQI